MRSVPSRRRLSSHACLHVLRARAFALLVDGHAELGRDDGAIAAPLERLSQKLFALGRAVDVGGVEEIDARLERGIDDALGGGGVDPHPEVVAAEADQRDAQRSDRTMHPSRQDTAYGYTVRRDVVHSS